MSESKLIYQKCGQCDNFFPPEYRECPYCYKAVEQPDFGNQPTAPVNQGQETRFIFVYRGRDFCSSRCLCSGRNG